MEETSLRKTAEKNSVKVADLRGFLISHDSHPVYLPDFRNNISEYLENTWANRARTLVFAESICLFSCHSNRLAYPVDFSRRNAATHLDSQ